MSVLSYTRLEKLLKQYDKTASTERPPKILGSVIGVRKVFLTITILANKLWTGKGEVYGCQYKEILALAIIHFCCVHLS